MSLDSANIDNELQLETYHGQITRNPSSPPAIIAEQSLADLQRRHCGADKINSYDQYRCTSLIVRQVASSGKRSAGCVVLPLALKHDRLAHYW